MIFVICFSLINRDFYAKHISVIYIPYILPFLIFISISSFEFWEVFHNSLLYLMIFLFVVTHYNELYSVCVCLMNYIVIHYHIIVNDTLCISQCW